MHAEDITMHVYSDCHFSMGLQLDFIIDYNLSMSFSPNKLNNIISVKIANLKGKK